MQLAQNDVLVIVEKTKSSIPKIAPTANQIVERIDSFINTVEQPGGMDL